MNSVTLYVQPKKSLAESNDDWDTWKRANAAFRYHVPYLNMSVISQ